jgi:hypothetical protein
MQWFDWFDRIVEGIVESELGYSDALLTVTSLFHCPFSGVQLNCLHRHKMPSVVKVNSTTNRAPQFFGNCMGV